MPTKLTRDEQDLWLAEAVARVSCNHYPSARANADIRAALRLDDDKLIRMAEEGPLTWTY